VTYFWYLWCFALVVFGAFGAFYLVRKGLRKARAFFVGGLTFSLPCPSGGAKKNVFLRE
jgi:hypothetical protein